jgi:hypothetical protein
MTAASRTTVRSFDGLLEEIDRAIQLAGQPERCAARADAVSHWGIQQQLDHLLITDGAVLDGLRRGLSGGLPTEPQGKPTLMGRLILWTGFIPRGKGKAPKFVLPGDRPAAEIAGGFTVMRGDYEALTDSLGEIERNRGTQAHPVRGHFTVAQWLRFAHLHHRHHWKIIDDILRAQAAEASDR